MTRFNVLVLNQVSAKGLSRLPAERYVVGADIATPDGVLVRSADLHSREIPASVKAIARAGAGTNNIPVLAMSARGVPVFNAPGANANAVKELVLAAMLLTARNLAPALRFVAALDPREAAMEKTVEDGKKAFAGFELAGHTLGIVGLGKVGCLVADAAIKLGMDVWGFDPHITVDAAWSLPAQVRKAASVDEVLRQSDFVSLHVPLIDATRHMVNADNIGLMRAGAVLLNFSREGVVDEAAVLAALDAADARQRLGWYACDFPSAAVNAHRRVVALPHLGASTSEAEENCAVMVAEQVRDFLEQGHVHNSVNFPEVELPRASPFRIICATSNQSNAGNQVADAVRAAGLTIAGMSSVSRGDLSYLIADLDAQPADDLMSGIGGRPGVLMARRL